MLRSYKIIFSYFKSSTICLMCVAVNADFYFLSLKKNWNTSWLVGFLCTDVGTIYCVTQYFSNLIPLIDPDIF